VSQFAAGCAVCGFDLEAARAEAAERGPTVGERLSAARPATLDSHTFRSDAFVVAVTVLLVLFFPLAGGALAAWTAYDRNRLGDERMRNIALGLLAVAIVLLALPELRYGIVFSLTWAPLPTR
jgi:hypothetical protein